jgi:hypothetical protein
MEDAAGSGGEFLISGRATLIEDMETRQIAVRCSSYQPADRYILFEFAIERAASTHYVGDETIRRNWTLPI